MRKLINLIQRCALLITIMSMTGLTESLQAQTICNKNSTGSRGGYSYELWKNNGGSACMTLKDDAAFSCEWSNVGNMLTRRGHRYNETKKHHQIGTFNASYSCDFRPNNQGNSFMGIYGWTSSPLIEFYIIDNWSNRRPGGGKVKATIHIDGGTYDIYETTRVNKPSIKGTRTFQQYWSVRRNKRSSGTLSVTKHFEQWERTGMPMGNMFDVNLLVEGVKSSGRANFSHATLTVGNNGGGGNGDSHNIVVRARGESGQESIRVRSDGNVLATYTLTTNYKNYNINTHHSGGLNIEYFNDRNGRDVQVDYVEVNGQRRQAEHQTYNTAVWHNGSCGNGSRSEWMHCNGVLGLGDINRRTAQTEALDLLDTKISDMPQITPYPNPSAEGLVHLNLNELDGEVHIEVLSLSGSVLKSVRTEANLQTIDMGGHTGMYLLRVSNGTYSFTKKIIVE